MIETLAATPDRIRALRRLLELWMEHDAGHIADMEALLQGRVGRTTADAA